MPETAPNRVNTARAIRELLGLRSQRINIYEDSALLREKPIPGKIASDGVREITFATQAVPSDDYLQFGVKNLKPANTQEQQDAIHETHRDFERVANLRFVALPPEKSADADVPIFCTDDVMDAPPAYTTTINGQEVTLQPRTLGYSTWKNGKFAIVMCSDSVRDIYAHELGHRKRLSHPDHFNEQYNPASAQSQSFSGYSPSYSNDGTIMSYHEGGRPEYKYKLGPYDIAVLQHLYGKPKQTPPAVLKAHELPSTIMGDVPLTLDYRTTPSFSPSLTLPPKESYVVAQGIRFFDGHRMAFGAEIRDAIFTGNPQNVTIEGNDLPNFIAGGLGENVLKTRGHNDVLAGDRRAKKTTFEIREYTRGHTVGLFNPDRDDLALPVNTHKVELIEEKRTGHSHGTDVIARSRHGEMVAQAFVVGVTPEQLQGRVYASGTERAIEKSFSAREDKKAGPFAHLPQARFVVEDVTGPVHFVAPTAAISRTAAKMRK